MIKAENTERQKVYLDFISVTTENAHTKMKVAYVLYRFVITF